MTTKLEHKYFRSIYGSDPARLAFMFIFLRDCLVSLLLESQ